MFEEEYEKLSRGEQNQFQEVLSNLLYHCFIVRRSFDKPTNTFKINPNYLFIERHFDLITSYLDFAGIEVTKDDDNGVIFTSSSFDVNKIRIDGVTTLLIYALRSYYEDKLGSNPTSNEVTIDSIALKSLLKELSLSTVNRRISAVTIQAGLRTLSSYNIIAIRRGSFSDVSYSFDILPSIRYAISNARLNSLYETLTSNAPVADTPFDVNKGEML